MYYVGIDQSKRSTGVAIIDENEQIKGFTIIANVVDDGVPLIRHQWDSLLTLMQLTIHDFGQLRGGLIEGLSFGSVGSGKDFLAGLQWIFRYNFEDVFGLHLGTVPVSMWRSQVLTKAEQREAKAEGKDGLKRAVYNKLPEQARQFVDGFVAQEGLKKTAIYDGADAYFIAVHCKKVLSNR